MNRTNLSSSTLSTCLRFLAVPFFLTTPPPAFLGNVSFSLAAFLRGEVTSLFFPAGTVNPDADPFSFAIARIFTRRSETARGVGASWLVAVGYRISVTDFGRQKYFGFWVGEHDVLSIEQGVRDGEKDYVGKTKGKITDASWPQLPER